jgi:dynein heavy chain
MTKFQKLLVLRVFRPDRLISSIQRFITEQIGSEYIETFQFNLKLCLQDSTAQTPLIFILSPGIDPLQYLYKYLAEVPKLDSKKLKVVSMGQGQTQTAIQLIQDSVIRDDWILVQNCHLSSSFLAHLEEIYEEVWRLCRLQMDRLISCLF